MNVFEKILEEVKKEIKINQGFANVSYNTDKGLVEVRAFTASGNVKPGSFRSTWFVNGVKMNKTEAKKTLNS